MVLKFENKRIMGPGSYAHKDNLKSNGCKWDSTNRCWYVPDEANLSLILKIIESINQKEQDEMKELWKKACENCGYKFVKKGTPEYNEVKEEMRQMMLEERQAF